MREKPSEWCARTGAGLAGLTQFAGHGGEHRWWRAIGSHREDSRDSHDELREPRLLVLDRVARRERSLAGGPDCGALQSDRNWRLRGLLHGCSRKLSRRITSALPFGAVGPWLWHGRNQSMGLRPCSDAARATATEQGAWGLAWTSLGIGAFLGPLLTLRLRERIPKVHA